MTENKEEIMIPVSRHNAIVLGIADNIKKQIITNLEKKREEIFKEKPYTAKAISEAIQLVKDAEIRYRD